jgi:2-polyprenyl-3-methyl-5-hydroxy-6-metoxy-1,4-benzoquinol methylase
MRTVPSLRLETLERCPLCGGTSIAPVLEAEDYAFGTGRYHIDGCGGCGVRFTNPRPIAKDVPLLYGSRKLEPLPGRKTFFGRVRAARLGRRIRGLWASFPEGSIDLAEVGAGDGFFASIAAEDPRCRRFTASDFSAEAPPLVRRAPPERIRWVGYEEFFALPDRYHVIFCRYVLEHVGDPAAFVAQLSERLHQGGVLVVEVPNWRAAWRRALGRYYSELSVPAHVLHYDPETLRRLLHGYDVEIRENTHGLVLARSLGHALGRELSRTGVAGMILGALEIVGDVVVGPPPNLTAIARRR